MSGIDRVPQVIGNNTDGIVGIINCYFSVKYAEAGGNSRECQSVWLSKAVRGIFPRYSNCQRQQ